VRRHYLDWLRGIAVLIMIEAHTLDSWTRVADRTRPFYAWGLIIGGFGAPMFLLLAGIALALAARSRLRKGMVPSDVAARGQRRGWQIFGLAFLFRLQSWLISGGPLRQVLLKVDILNIMGPSMIVAAWLWRIGRSDRARALLFIGRNDCGGDGDTTGSRIGRAECSARRDRVVSAPVAGPDDVYPVSVGGVPLRRCLRSASGSTVRKLRVWNGA
jgi:hypothetical protein